MSVNKYTLFFLLILSVDVFSGTKEEIDGILFELMKSVMTDIIFPCSGDGISGDNTKQNCDERVQSDNKIREMLKAEDEEALRKVVGGYKKKGIIFCNEEYKFFHHAAAKESKENLEELRHIKLPSEHFRAVENILSCADIMKCECWDVQCAAMIDRMENGIKPLFAPDIWRKETGKSIKKSIDDRTVNIQKNILNLISCGCPAVSRSSRTELSITPAPTFTARDLERSALAADVCNDARVLRAWLTVAAAAFSESFDADMVNLRNISSRWRASATTRSLGDPNPPNPPTYAKHNETTYAGYN